MRGRHAVEAAADERDVGGLDRDVGAGADRDADVRLGEGRSVVDAVADHRDHLAALLQLLDPRRLVGGQHLREDLRDADPRGDRGAPSRSRSPVSIATFRPALRQAPDRARRRGFSRSATARRPSEPAVGADEQGRLPLGREARDLVAHGGDVDAFVSNSRALPTSDPAAPDRPATPRPVLDCEVRRRAAARSLSPRPRRRSPGRAGGRSPSRAPRPAPGARLRRLRRRGTRSVSRGRPSVIVPVLSSRTRVDGGGPLEGVGVAEQDPGPRAAARADEDRRRRRQAQRAGTRDDEDRARRRPSRRSPAARGRRTYQATHVTTAMPSTTGTKTPEIRSASFWIGGFDAWACWTRRTIWASAVALPTAVASMSNAPSPLRVPPRTGRPGPFSTGIDSPVTIDSSTAERPDADDAVDGNRVARLDAQEVAGDDLGERHLASSRFLRATSRAVFGARSSSLRTAAEVSPAGARLEIPPEEHEREDHAHGLVVDVAHRAAPRLPPWLSGRTSTRSTAGAPPSCRSRRACPCWRCGGTASGRAPAETARRPRDRPAG